jgi:predicted SAM-dependent methyltransferase
METLMMRSRFKLTVGCDIYRPYLDQLRRKNYDGLVLCDASKLPFRKKSFSVCLAVEVIEHLEKDEAIACLKSLEEIITNIVIVTTPNGFTRQKSLTGNPYEEHKSGMGHHSFRSLWL